MNFIECPVGVSALVENCAGSFRCFQSRLLMGIVDAIWDVDIPDGDAARAIAIKYAPGTSLLLMAQYRAPVRVRHRDLELPNKCATQIQASSVTLQATGALGLIIISLRPEAASRIVDAPLGQFANAGICLGDVFSRGDVSTCDEMLAGARNGLERVATVECFLLRRLRPQRDSLACHAASYLRSDPTLPLRQLASMLSVSTRHLARTFSATFGITPKRFARLARIEKIMSERRGGLPWAQVASACGLADQAHLIREFRDIVGEVPAKFFAQEVRVGLGKIGEANFVVQRTLDNEL
jgi:AraC-like DNA-binding protein